MKIKLDEEKKLFIKKIFVKEVQRLKYSQIGAVNDINIAEK